MADQEPGAVKGKKEFVNAAEKGTAIPDGPLNGTKVYVLAVIEHGTRRIRIPVLQLLFSGL